MATNNLLHRVQGLGDLELAVLLSLMNHEHCMINTEPSVVEDLVHELDLIASKVFGLSSVVVQCGVDTNVEDFATSILESRSVTREETPQKSKQDSYLSQSPAFKCSSRSPCSDNFPDVKQIANVVIAKNLDETPKEVQIQALELIRTKRILTRTSLYNAPKAFLLIAVIAGNRVPPLTKHLNDHIFISHYHGIEDGFPNMEDLADDSDSLSSVVRKSQNTSDTAKLSSIFEATDLEYLETQAAQTTVSMELEQYMHNIVVFLRLHRAVGKGISPLATRHFGKLIRSLAPLHGQDFVTPSLVCIAARKIYPHRIHMVEPQNERSMQWGSDLDAVTAALEGLQPETVIEEVLATVEVPL